MKDSGEQVSLKRSAATLAGIFLCAGCPSTCDTPRPHNPDGIRVPRDVQFSGTLPVVALGGGVSLSAGTTADACVSFDGAEPPTPAVGSKSFYKMFVQESRSLRQSLGLAAGASFGAGLSHGSASMTFLNAEETNSESAYLILDAYLIYAPQIRTGAHLTASAAQKLAGNPAQFMASCGDMYVYSLTKGARFRAIYRFSSLSSTAKSNLRAELSVGGASWAANASFSQNLERAVSRYESELYVVQEGGKIERTKLTPADLIAQAAAFGAEATVEPANAVTLSMSARSYYAISDFPANLKIPDLLEQQRQVEGIEDDYDLARSLRGDIKMRLNRPGRLNEPVCAATKGQLETSLKSLVEYVRDATAKVDACQIITASGATEACKKKLDLPIHEMPQVPATCGPRCTSTPGSIYEVDSQGYCVRCAWPQRDYDGPEHASGHVLEATCSYMRRGARVQIAAQGSYYTNCDPNWTPWLDIALQGSSGAFGAPACEPGSQCRNIVTNSGVVRGTPRQPEPFSLTSHLVTGDPSTTTWLQQAYCSAPHTKGCAYRGVAFDICDEDGVDCRQPPAGKSINTVANPR